MGELGALGEPGRARRVEDRDVVVGVDVGVGEGGRRCVGVDHLVPAIDATREVALGAHGEQVERCVGSDVVEDRQHALDTLVVGDEHLGLRVAEAVGHLGWSPPRVHPDCCGADRRDRPVGHDPFRIVAHRDGDPVTRADPVDVAQVVREGAGPCADLGVAVALVLVDDVRLVAMELGELPDRSHVGWGVLEHSHRITPYLDLGDTEPAPGCRQLSPGLIEIVEHAAESVRTNPTRRN